MNYNEKKNAGTWINLQDAYFQEKDAVGSWEDVGYSAPGNGSSNSYASNTFTYTSTDANHDWVATPKSKLNDCTTAMNWQLVATRAAEGVMTIGDNGTDPACKILTASWDGILRSSN